MLWQAAVIFMLVVVLMLNYIEQFQSLFVVFLGVWSAFIEFIIMHGMVYAGELVYRSLLLTISSWPCVWSGHLSYLSHVDFICRKVIAGNRRTRWRIDRGCTVHIFKSIHAHLGYYLCFSSLAHETKQLYKLTNLHSTNELVKSSSVKYPFTHKLWLEQTYSKFKDYALKILCHKI